MKKFLSKLCIASLLALSAQGFFIVKPLSAQGFFIVKPPQLNSAVLTSVKDTLSSSRLSYYNSLAPGNAVGSTLVRINTSGMPSTNTINLFTNDSVWIGTAGTGSTYVIDNISDADEFQITTGLGASDADQNDLVIATRSASHLITFTTATAIADGAIRILIPSGTNNNNDGIPNHDGFDFNSIVAAGLTAPSGGGVTSWESPTATASGGTWCSAGKHCFESRYNGTNSLAPLINPTIGAGHSAGTADTYTITIQHLNNSAGSYAVVDETKVKIAIVESVRVTASIDPTLTFAIAAVSLGTTSCGEPADVSSTATTIPFGTLTLDTFKNIAQTLTVSTNADSGYSVTAVENDQLGKDGNTSPNIADTPGDNSAATHNTSDEWVTNTNVYGFGYSLENDDASTIAFEYTTSTGNCSGVFCSRQFADANNSEAVVELFSSATTADSENANVCYRININSDQEAGDYQNNITYTATATF